MRVAILYNQPRAGADASDQDVLVQRDTIAAALRVLGHSSVSVGCTLDLASLRHDLEHLEVDCVFNLVESLGGTDRLQPLVPLMLEALGIPFTGSSGAAMLATSDKVAVKRRLRQQGLPTPDWVSEGEDANLHGPGRFIVKARFEHASIGMDDRSVVNVDDVRRLPPAIAERGDASGHAMFAERFIDGREFNIALLAGEDEVKVLAPAEIDFSAFPPDKPRIVGYDAKWCETSFEFNATPRRFSFDDVDRSLIDKLSALSRTVWQVFGLGGYARVDFRVDAAGDPQILEINTNPCLSPDAGYAAALAASGYSFQAAVECIIADALEAARQ